MSTSRIRISLSALLLSAALGGCSRDAPPAPGVRYSVEAVEGRGIVVEGRFRDPGGSLGVEIPASRGASPPVGAVEANDGEGRPLEIRRETKGGAWRWTVDNPREGEVVLRYGVSGEDPLGRADATFLDGERTVLVGSDLFLIPAGIEPAAAADITVDLRVARGWPVWSTWGMGATDLRPACFEDLVHGFAVAGDFSERSLGSGDARAVILVEGRGTGRTGLTVANRLLPVLREAVDLFGSSPRGGRFEVLAVYRFHPRDDRRSTMSGIGKDRGFLCLASPDRYEDLRDITALAAHECLHAWLGGALRVAAESPHANAPELIWFLEGLTEYLSWRLLRDAGVIDAGTYAEVAAAKREKAAAVGRGLRLADAAARVAEVRIYELVYTRGFLVAELLQSRMDESCGAGTFDEVLRGLFRKHNAYTTGVWLDAEVVRDAFGDRCPAAREVIVEEAERGRDLPPSALFTSRGK